MMMGGFGGYGGYGNMMGGWGYGAGGFGSSYGWLGLLVQALFLLALITLGVYLFRRWSSPSVRPATTSALDILQGRFARGEITIDEYNRMKKELNI